MGNVGARLVTTGWDDVLGRAVERPPGGFDDSFDGIDFGAGSDVTPTHHEMILISLSLATLLVSISKTRTSLGGVAEMSVLEEGDGDGRHCIF